MNDTSWFKYGIVAVHRTPIGPGEIFHFVGFPDVPTVDDWLHIYDELLNDPDFKYEERSFYMKEATPEEVERYKDIGVIADRIPSRDEPDFRYQWQESHDKVDLFDPSSLIGVKTPVDLTNWVEQASMMPNKVRADEKDPVVFIHSKVDGLLLVSESGEARYMTLLEKFFFNWLGITPKFKK